MTTVVFPCFNEERRIGATVEATRRFLEARGTPWEIVVVDDGSPDATSAEVERRSAGDARVRLLRYQTNHGKGWATREGFRAATGELVLLSDADLSTPITELAPFELAAAEGFDLVVGSRVVAGASVRVAQPLRRRISGWIFRRLVHGLGLTFVHDSQCGFKLMRRATVGPVFDRVETPGFAFDVELLARAERAGLRIAELPVEWRDDAAGSRLRLVPDALRMARDLARIRARVR